jgi:pimeloyl-ACP methyl ester carboxylesterase
MSAAYFGASTPAAAMVGLGAAALIFASIRRLANKLLVIQVANSWVFNRAYAHGRPSCFDAAIEAAARRLVAVAGAADTDEVLLIGHSSGAGMAPLVLARALELDPNLGRHGPRIVLLTLGSLLPCYALHPRAQRARRAVERLAIEATVVWIDAQARQDFSNFWNFDCVTGLGLNLPAERRNPHLWRVRFRDMLSEEIFERVRWSLFRMHFQFIMGGNRRAPYDFFMNVCGPLPVTDWLSGGRATADAFGGDGTYLPSALPLSA